MKTITFLGQELNIAFNMAVQIAYEKITDKPFDLTDMAKAESRLSLYYAVIIANNPDSNVTIEQVMRESSFDDIRTIDNAVNAAISEWYHIPAPAEGKVPEQTEEEKTEASKNA